MDPRSSYLCFRLHAHHAHIDDLDVATDVVGLGKEARLDFRDLVELVLHRRGHDVALLYGLRPFTVDDWMSDPLRHSGPPTRRRG